jgi:hypothetical protein
MYLVIRKSLSIRSWSFSGALDGSEDERRAVLGEPKASLQPLSISVTGDQFRN